MDVLRTYIESRVWLAVRRASRLVMGRRQANERGRRGSTAASFVSLTYGCVASASSPSGMWRITRTWRSIVRPSGLNRQWSGKLREAGRYAAVGSDRGLPPVGGRGDSPLRGADRPVRRMAAAKLDPLAEIATRHRPGSDHLAQPVGVGRAGEGRTGFAAPQATEGRLALAQLSLPDAIVVVGGAAQASWRSRQARVELERALNGVRSLGLPVEVIGSV